MPRPYESGLSLAKVAEAAKASRSAAQKHLAEAGVQLRDKSAAAQLRLSAYAK